MAQFLISVRGWKSAISAIYFRQIFGLKFSFGDIAMFRSDFRVVAFALSVVLLCACSRGERPIKLLQFCAKDEEGIKQLKIELAAIARERQLEFSDNGESVKRDLEAVGYTERVRKNGSIVVSLVAKREDGMGLSALNAGLYPYQIALGFSAGKDQAESSKFVEDVVARLRQKWTLDEVPSGAGVTPNENCR